MAEAAYKIAYDQATVEHLATIERRHHSLIRRTVEEQLSYEPERETRNRKPLRVATAFGATWELRCGPTNRFRVLYRIDETERTVRILAIGIKERNRLLIAGQEAEA